MNKLCIYCRKITNRFSDEHVIPKALGGSIILKNAVCDNCNNVFSREFEMAVFKGENSPFAFLRSWTGMKGRREIPIFGKEGHGQPVLLTVKEGYPQIQEYLVDKDTFWYPQFIFIFEDGFVKRYDYIKDNNENFKEDIESMFVEEGIDKNKIKKLYFWYDSKATSVYGGRLFEKGLREWAEFNNVAWELFDETAKGKSARIVINMNWRIIERLISKIMLNFLFYKIQEPNFWFLPIGGHIVRLTNETEGNFKKDFGLTFNYLDKSSEEFSEENTKKIIEEIVNHPIMSKKILEL